MDLKDGVKSYKDSNRCSWCWGKGISNKGDINKSQVVPVDERTYCAQDLLRHLSKDAVELSGRTKLEGRKEAEISVTEMSHYSA